jgi:hypothetical protein|nr:MAG TPA: hypothetical protein [Bacteriophage sp.]
MRALKFLQQTHNDLTTRYLIYNGLLMIFVVSGNGAGLTTKIKDNG